MVLFSLVSGVDFLILKKRKEIDLERNPRSISISMEFHLNAVIKKEYIKKGQNNEKTENKRL